MRARAGWSGRKIAVAGRLLLLLPSIVAACSEDGGTPWCGDLRVLREPILNGGAAHDPAIAALDAGQDLRRGHRYAGGP